MRSIADSTAIYSVVSKPKIKKIVEEVGRAFNLKSSLLSSFFCADQNRDL